VAPATILLVDDEPEVLAVATEMLEEFGYRVLGASSVATAISLAKQKTERIDLLVTDVMMPHMNGPELAGEITSLRPGLKVLYLSGRVGYTIVGSGTAVAGAAILHKPFTTTELARKVQEVLDSPMVAA
jgi:CheY-like chemotaxis protein